MRPPRPPRALGLLVTILGCAGCGGSSPYAVRPDLAPTEADESRQAALLNNDLHSLDDELVGELSEVAAQPELDRCEDACNLCFNICDLRERICVIAGNHPENATLFEQCVDASVRCKRGTRDTDAVCDCSEVEVRVRI